MRIIRGNLCTPSWRHNVYGEVSVCRNSSLCRYVPMNSASSEMGTFPHVLLPQKWGNSCTMVGPTICADISPLAVGAGIRGDFLMYFATSKMGKYPHNVWSYYLCGYFPMSRETGKFPRVLCYLRSGEISAQCFVVRIFPHSQCQLGYGEISSCPLLPQKWGNIRTMFRCADISPFAVPAGIRGNFLMSFATSEMGKYPHL